MDKRVVEDWLGEAKVGSQPRFLEFVGPVGPGEGDGDGEGGGLLILGKFARETRRYRV